MNYAIYAGSKVDDTKPIVDAILSALTCSAGTEEKIAAIDALGKILTVGPITISNCHFNMNKDNNVNTAYGIDADVDADDIGADVDE